MRFKGFLRIQMFFALFINNSNSKFLFKGLEKKNHVELGCRGMNSPRIFAQLDRICEDCYNLYRDTEVFSSCRYYLKT